MFTVRPAMRLCPVGTSITAGGVATQQPRGWWPDVVGIGGQVYTGNNVRGASGISGATSGSLSSIATNPPVAVHMPTLAEIGGAKMSDLLAIWSTIVTPFEPIDAFLLEGNINDIFAATNTTTFRTQVQTMLGLTGSRPVLWMGALLGMQPVGEKPSLFGNAFNLSIDSYNTIVGQEIANIGSRGTFMDLRPAIKTLETSINGGDLGLGILTTDGVHLSEYGLGVVKNLSRSYVTFST